MCVYETCMVGTKVRVCWKTPSSTSCKGGCTISHFFITIYFDFRNTDISPFDNFSSIYGPPLPARARPSSSPPATESTGEGPKVCKQRPRVTTLWWHLTLEISYLRLVANSRLDRIKKLWESNVIFIALKDIVSRPVPNSPVYGTYRVWVLYCACHRLLYSWSSSLSLSWRGQTFRQGFIKH